MPKALDAIKLVEGDGWRFARQHASHRIYKHDRKPGTVTIAGHPNIDLSPGAWRSILRQAGLAKEP